MPLIESALDLCRSFQSRVDIVGSVWSLHFALALTRISFNSEWFLAIWKPKIEGSAIVLAGSFNPSIVQPNWLAAGDLIRRDEADRATEEGIEVISPQITSFSLDWAKIQVTPERFAAEALSAAQRLEIASLVAGIFGLLEHTPISAMGLHWRAHYKLRSEETWHLLGDKLAPKELWRDVLTSEIRGGAPGLRTLVIEGRRESTSAEWTRIKIEPSVRVDCGVYIEVHEEFSDREPRSGAPAVLMDALKDCWEEFLRDSSRMADKVLSWSQESP